MLLMERNSNAVEGGKGRGNECEGNKQREMKKKRGAQYNK